MDFLAFGGAVRNNSGTSNSVGQDPLCFVLHVRHVGSTGCDDDGDEYASDMNLLRLPRGGVSDPVMSYSCTVEKVLANLTDLGGVAGGGGIGVSPGRGPGDDMPGRGPRLA